MPSVSNPGRQRRLFKLHVRFCTLQFWKVWAAFKVMAEKDKETSFRIIRFLKNFFFPPLELKHFRAFQVLPTHSTYPPAWWQFVAVFFVNIIISWQIGRKPLSSATVRLIHSSWLLKQWRNRKALPVVPVWNVIPSFSRKCCLWGDLEICCCCLLGSQNHFSLLFTFNTLC